MDKSVKVGDYTVTYRENLTKKEARDGYVLIASRVNDARGTDIAGALTALYDIMYSLVSTCKTKDGKDADFNTLTEELPNNSFKELDKRLYEVLADDATIGRLPLGQILGVPLEQGGTGASIK